MIKSLGKITNPADTLSHIINSGVETCVAFEFNHTQYYSTGLNIPVGVLCYCSKDALQATFSTSLEPLRKAITEQSNNVRDTYEQVLQARGLPDIDLLSPLLLETTHVSKPWGSEIWYTGIEERGVCAIQTIPLPWILEVFSSTLTGTRELTPILLKILDPYPEKVYGDLYFELHQHKREVYVVTNVDENAWPDSIGKIRFGFSPEKISAYPSEQQFKDAYLTCVGEYQHVRNRIDTKLDEFRSQAETEKDELITPEIITGWKNRIDPALLTHERNLRHEMESFTAQRDLRVGDVVHVNPQVPHSLQHGVRVIEFQTPHYERYILSFAQKVLTQNHWDTKRALEHVRLEAEPEPKAKQLSDAESLVADFNEFQATRIILQPGAGKLIDNNTYCLVIGVTGTADLGSQKLNPEDGYYIPACANALLVRNSSQNEPVTFLIAKPTDG